MNLSTSNNNFTYTAVIRTLGKAGTKYQTLLNSLKKQTILPERILVYIAEGYPIPNETIGIEEYIYVRKGMVAQRALPYNEVKSKYILFLDDDLFLPPSFVELLYKHLVKEQADVISPDIYPNAERPILSKITMTLSGRMLARSNDNIWGYKVMRNSGYSYNSNPIKDIYLSQTNAGACFLIKKTDFLKIHFEEELWMDNMPYAMGDDEVMFYKMHRYGLKQLTLFNSGIKHLDAGCNLQNTEKDKTRIYCDFRFKTIFWHRFIFLPETSWLVRLWSIICLTYTFTFSLLISLCKGQWSFFKIKFQAIRNGFKFLHSKEYKLLPLIP